MAEYRAKTAPILPHLRGARAWSAASTAWRPIDEVGAAIDAILDARIDTPISAMYSAFQGRRATDGLISHLIARFDWH